jgi:hypothetical protein
MDLWHTPHFAEGRLRRGWLGRYLDQLPAETVLAAIHYGGEEQPLALAAERKLAVSLRSLDALRMEPLPGVSNDRFRQLLSDERDSPNRLLGFVQENAQLAWLTGERLKEVASQTARRSDYPSLSPWGKSCKSSLP